MADTDVDLLVAAAQAGGGWAFGRLWEDFSPAVAAYLRRRGIRDADDLTSEVFLAAFRGIQAFEGDGSAFRGWVFTIAHHKAVDAVRRGVHLREVLHDVVDDGRSGPSAEDTVLENEATRDVMAVLDTLTVDQRDVILLRVIGELSLDEVARALGKPVGAVKQLQRRALSTLRRNLSGRAITSADLTAIGRVR